MRRRRRRRRRRRQPLAAANDVLLTTLQAVVYRRCVDGSNANHYSICSRPGLFSMVSARKRRDDTIDPAGYRCIPPY